MPTMKGNDMEDYAQREIASSIALSIAEACGLCSLGRTSFYELISSNVIPTYKVGRRRLVLRHELQQALKSFPRAGRVA